MRILLTADPELPVPPKLYGGIERIIDMLIRELIARGHEVGLAAHPDSAVVVSKSFPWPGPRSQNRWNTLHNTVALWHAVQEFKPNVLHSFSRLGYMLPLLRTRLPKLMSYQRHTGGHRNRIAALLGGSRFAFTACSEYIARQGRHWGGRWVVVPNFVDTNYYTFVPSVSKDAPLVFLSRIERIKGAHTAIEIAKRAGRRLVIAGNRVNEGEAALYWEHEIAPHIDQNGIEYVGPVNDAEKNQLLGSAAAMVVPVDWDEPFGIVFVEALACGTPIISTPRGALPEILEHGTHGFLVTSAAEGANAVNRLGVISRSECRKRAEEHFSSSVVAEQYLALYSELVSRVR